MQTTERSELFKKQAENILSLVKSDTSKLKEKIDFPIINNYWDGITLLGIACMYGDKEAIKNLLEAGADPNQTFPGYKQKYTPLFTFINCIQYTDLPKEDILDIARLFVKSGADIDFIPEGDYKFDACNFAEYHGYNYLAAEFFRLGADIRVREQNTGINIKEYQAVSSTGIRYLAYEEYLQFLQSPENYQLPKGIHKNTQKVLEQCFCSIDIEKSQVKVTYQESDEYYRTRFEVQKQIKMFDYNEERFSKTEIYPVSESELKGLNAELAQDQMKFADIISLSKLQQNGLTSFEELFALYEIDNNSNEGVVELQGYNSDDDDFAFVRLECN